MSRRFGKLCFGGTRTPRCAGGACAGESHGSGRTFVKRGYYRAKWNGQPVPRYRCRICGKWFSSRTFRATYRQHRPDLNQMVLDLYSSGMTQRRMAIVLDVNRKTIVRKFLFLAHLSRKTHEAKLVSADIRTGDVQFDEMETYEHTRLKPVTIALAVRTRTGEILDAVAAPIPYKGPLASIARAKYGARPSRAKLAVRSVLAAVARCRRPELTLTSDCHPHYPRHVRELLPGARHMRAVRENRERTSDRRNRNDKLWRLNATAMLLRGDLSRLARRTWVTTKRIDRLQAHLDLYLAFNNGYDIPA